MIPREKIIGRTITDVLKSHSEIGPAPILEGITVEGDTWELFDIYLVLDDSDLLKLGLDERYSPMELFDKTARETMHLARHEEASDRRCVGHVIKKVYREGMGFIIELKSGHALWLDDSAFGSELAFSETYLQKDQDSTVLPLRDYWEDEQ